VDRLPWLHDVCRPPIGEREPALGDVLFLGLDQTLRTTLGQ
jgi:hypothetical protein